MGLLVCLGLRLISCIHRSIYFCLNGSPNISPPSGWHPPTAMHRITCQIHNFQIESDNSYNMNIFAQSLNSLHQIHPDTPNPLEQSWYFCNLLSWTIHHLQKSLFGQKSVFLARLGFQWLKGLWSVWRASSIELFSLIGCSRKSWIFSFRRSFFSTVVIWKGCFHLFLLKETFFILLIAEKAHIWPIPIGWFCRGDPATRYHWLLLCTTFHLNLAPSSRNQITLSAPGQQGPFSEVNQEYFGVYLIRRLTYHLPFWLIKVTEKEHLGQAARLCIGKQFDKLCPLHGLTKISRPKVLFNRLEVK